jgi:transcriptional regulator with XRE-family HTH domain
MMRDTLGARLRTQRERKRIALSAIAERTKIRASVFEALERDDPSGWPAGIYRRAFVRAYAEAIGIDPEPVVREFVARFPDPTEDTPPTPPAPAAGAHQPDELFEPLRLTLADSDSRLARHDVRATAGGRQRAYSALCDLAVVTVAAVVGWMLAGLFWRPFTIATVCYYFGGIVLCGSSPATWLAERRFGRTRAPAAAPAIVQLAAKRSRTGRVGQVQPMSIELEPVRELDEAV